MRMRIKAGKGICRSIIVVLASLVLLTMTSALATSAIGAQEERYSELGPLFTLNAEAERCLREGPIGEALKQQFELEEFPLPDDTRLKKVGREWLLLTSAEDLRSGEGDQIIHIIREENGKCKAYLHWRFRPVVISCNKDGVEVNQFAPGEDVYVMGKGFWPRAHYQILIQDEPVRLWEKLSKSEDPSGQIEKIRTNKSGEFGPTLIWSIPEDAPITHHQYDIVVDKLGWGVFRYTPLLDGLDSAICAGIVAPVPDASALALFGSGLVLVSTSFLMGRMRRRRRRSGG